MSKENIYTLLHRYQNGHCSEREKRVVEQWFAALGEEIPERTDLDNKELEERIWNRIQDQAKPNVIRFRWQWMAAAAVLFTLAWGAYHLKSSTKPSKALEMVATNKADHLQSYKNSTKIAQNYTLPDGSKNTLAPGSVISFKPNFDGETRDVYLTGKAFFNVTKNPDRPFHVHTGEVITKVLGTSFWVDGTKDSEAIEISVVSGKVSVSQKDNNPKTTASNIKDGVILTPNQKVKYTSQSHTFETGLVINPKPIVPKEVVVEELFIFQDVPVSEVIKKLEKTYGIEIIVDTDNLNGCLFKGNITQQPLFTKLDILCTSIDAHYEVRGTRILISGKGCSTDQLNP